MENWNTTVADIGAIREGRSVMVDFKGNLTMPEVLSVTAECGCTKPKFDRETRNLRVKYSSGNIPNHIKEDKQTIYKRVFVNYKNGKQDILYIKGVKLRK